MQCAYRTRTHKQSAACCCAANSCSRLLQSRLCSLSAVRCTLYEAHASNHAPEICGLLTRLSHHQTLSDQRAENAKARATLVNTISHLITMQLVKSRLCYAPPQPKVWRNNMHICYASESMGLSITDGSAATNINCHKKRFALTPVASKAADGML
jgi:hypothetical protein